MKKNIFDIIESYYAARVLVQLSNRGIFREPRKKRQIKTYFPNRDVFQFISSRTDLIESGDGKTFTVNPKYNSYPDLGFHIEKFLQAYGEVNTEEKTPAIVTDQKKFAEAFQFAAAFNNPGAVLNIFSQLGAQTLLDLGCGTGSVISHFCKADNNKKAFGIDQNPHLLSIAKETSRKKKLGGQMKLFKGSVKDFEKLLSPANMKMVDVVYASSILNEFFYSPAELVKLLKKLRKHFPGKFLVVVDYYGTFHTRQSTDKTLQHNYVHDVMQILSGQGVPPEDKKGWNEYYVRSNCQLMQAFEGNSNGINWFIHLVKLGDK